MNNALSIYDGGRFEIMQRTAQAMVASGYFKDSRDLAQAVVKIMAGAELGIPPFAAMTGINIIQGKPAIGSCIVATLVKNDPRYDYRVKRCNDTACVIEWIEDGKAVGVSDFTIEEAKRAGLTNKDNWQKYPSDMLFARAITRGARRFAPGIFGGAPVYTPDELGADVDPDGYVDFEAHAPSPDDHNQDIEGEYTEAPPVPRNPAPVTRQTQSPATVPPQNGGATQAIVEAAPDNIGGYHVGDAVLVKGKNDEKPGAVKGLDHEGGLIAVSVDGKVMWLSTAKLMKPPIDDNGLPYSVSASGIREYRGEAGKAALLLSLDETLEKHHGTDGAYSE